MSKNFFFIDDSGSKEWETPYSLDFTKNPPERSDQNLNFWRRNYFVLAGLHISQEAITRLNPAINDLKIKYFGTKHIEVKSEWLRNPEKRRRKYLETYNLTEERLKEFTDEWYQILLDNPADIQVQAFVLDKRFFNKLREERLPLQVLVQVLFDRVELHPANECAIIFDQMDNDIHSEKHVQGQILRVADKEIDLGSFHKKYSHARPRFEKSKDSNFLQLADTIAYNVWRQFVSFGDVMENEDITQKTFYPFFERMIPNLYHKDGRISGVGIVKVPDPTKAKWGKEEEN